MDQYGLYKEDRKRKTIEVILEKMRRNISIDMITANVVDPRTGRPGAATIAFTLGFKSINPVQAQKVAGEITTLFLNENLKSRTEKAAETYDFLTSEVNRLNIEITRYETQLAEFKERNQNALPESQTINEQALARTEREIASIDTQIQTLKQSKIYIEGQLPLLDPYGAGESFMSPSERLKILRTSYITLSSRYSPDHPDVASVKREIKALERETGNYASPDDLVAQINILQQELSTAEQLYTHEHPDIKNLKRQIAALEEELQNPPIPVTPKLTNTNQNNPLYINLQLQLEAADTEIRSISARRAKLQDKISEYEERLLQMPRVTQEYRVILRKLNNTTRRYQSAMTKQTAAEIGQEMEKERKGEKFTLIEPAVLPEEPISPNRPAIIFLSMILALGAGVGSAAAAENMSSAVRGSKGLMAILQVAPLSVIPYLPNAADARVQAKKNKFLIFSVVAGLIILVLLVHFLYSPLDVLWFRGMRKIDKLAG